MKLLNFPYILETYKRVIENGFTKKRHL